MRRALRIFDKAIGYACVLAFAGMMLILCLQIFYRYVLSSPLVWSTPMSMFLFVWAIWLGGAIGIREGTQIRVEFAELFLPRGILRVLAPTISILCCSLLTLAIWKSFRIIEMQSSAIYDTLPFMRDKLFIVVPIVGSIMLFYYICLLWQQIQDFSVTHPETEKGA